MFNIGDTVRVTRVWDSFPVELIGATGTVVNMQMSRRSPEEKLLGVAFDFSNSIFHDVDGAAAPGHGYWIHNSCLELADALYYLGAWVEVTRWPNDAWIAREIGQVVAEKIENDVKHLGVQFSFSRPEFHDCEGKGETGKCFWLPAASCRVILPSFENNPDNWLSHCDVPPYTTPSIQLNGKMFRLYLEPASGDMATDVRRQLSEAASVARGQVADMARQRYDRLEATIRDLSAAAHKTIQMPAVTRELVSYGVQVFVENGRLCYLMPFRYEPKTLLHQGKRYALSEGMSRKLVRNVLLEVQTQKGAIAILQMLKPSTMEVFVHYHTTVGHVCTGTFDLKRYRVDSDLFNLLKLRDDMQALLREINADSRGTTAPSGLPNLEAVIEETAQEAAALPSGAWSLK